MCSSVWTETEAAYVWAIMQQVCNNYKLPLPPIILYNSQLTYVGKTQAQYCSNLLFLLINYVAI